MTYSKSSSLISSLSLLVAFLGIGDMISCSESNKPQVKNSNNSTFYVDAVTASFTTVGDANAQGVHNKKLLSLEACLKDNAQTNSVNNLNFKLSAGDISTSKSTDYRGCILWQELVEFDPQESEKNVFMTRSLEALQSHSGTEKIVFSVNPWKEQFTFNRQASTAGSVSAGPVSYKAKDVSQSAGVNYDYDVYVKISESGDNGVLSSYQRQAEVSTLYLKSQGIVYSLMEIDKMLNLTFPYEFDVKLSVNLLKQTVNGLDWEKIKRGNFKFHLAFTESLPADKEPSLKEILAVSEFSGIPTGEANMIVVPIVVNFRKVSSLTKRVGVYLSVTSTDTPALFAPQTYIGKVNGIDAASNLEVSLRKTSVDARQLFQTFNNREVVIKRLTAEEVLKSEGFKAIANPIYDDKLIQKGWFGEKLSETNYYVNLKTHFESYGGKDRLSDEETKALCSFIFTNETHKNKGKNFETCSKNPKKYLSAELRDFVEDVEGKPERVFPGKQETLNITSTFELSENKDVEQGYGLAGNVGFGVELGGELGGNIGKGSESSEGSSNSFKHEKKKESGPDDDKKTETSTYEKANALSKSQTWAAKLTAALKLNFGLDGKGYASTGFKVAESDGNVVSIASTEALKSQPITLQLKVKSKKCLLVVVKDEYKKIASDAGFSTAKYYCDSVARETSMLESYYLLVHQRSTESNPIVDIYSPYVNPLNILVRGNRPYGLLKSVLTSKDFSFRIFVDLYEGMRGHKVLDKESNFMTEEAPQMLSSSRKPLL